ncbi:MAG TPA: alpha/beta hydrolase [Gammaproteobacteria bacterium]|nr:alpha/beta hydrolase [Gammaproteobacteria bacterium]
MPAGLIWNAKRRRLNKMRHNYKSLFLIFLLLPFTGKLSAGELVTFPSEDGLLITADVHAPHKNSAAPIIVLFHQAGSSRGEYAEIAPWLNTLGYNCIAVDQRSGGSMNGIQNETAIRAENENRPTGYISALPDIKAALVYARRHYGKRGVIAWGSSYSAALVLKVAGDSPALVDGVLAFSPGEYFERAGKSATWIQDSANNIKVPVFITSARNEADQWSGIFSAVASSRKVAFIPETAGRHGSRALWRKYPDSQIYRDEAKNFLQRHFPAAFSLQSAGKPSGY